MCSNVFCLFFFFGHNLQQGAVGLAIWVPSVTTRTKISEASDTEDLPRGYSVLSPVEDKNEVWRQTGEGKDVELSVIGDSGNHDQMDADTLLEDLKVFGLLSYWEPHYLHFYDIYIVCICYLVCTSLGQNASTVFLAVIRFRRLCQAII